MIKEEVLEVYKSSLKSVEQNLQIVKEYVDISLNLNKIEKDVLGEVSVELYKVSQLLYNIRMNVVKHANSKYREEVKDEN